MAIVSLSLVTGAVASSQAGGLRDYLEGSQTVADGNTPLLSELASYYRMNANVRLGREHRLANGVAWRVLTDIKTGTAAPRITWMTDADSQLKANDLFEAVHGEALVDNEVRDLDRLTADLDAWKDGHPSEWVVKPPYFYPEKIAVTYASSRLVSYFEIRREVRLMSIGVDVYGRVLDLDQNRVREIKGCGRYDVEYDFSTFRYGDWLDVCADAAYDRFMALWKDKVRQGARLAQTRGDRLSQQCAESMETPRPNGRRMALYLTPEGLGVFNQDWKASSPKECAVRTNLTVNPVILSYRDLEPFMKPGPWRDELLNQPSPRTP